MYTVNIVNLKKNATIIKLYSSITELKKLIVIMSLTTKSNLQTMFS